MIFRQEWLIERQPFRGGAAAERGGGEKVPKLDAFILSSVLQELRLKKSNMKIPEADVSSREGWQDMTKKMFFVTMLSLFLFGLGLATAAGGTGGPGAPVGGLVPEPVSLLILGLGLFGLAGYGRRKWLKK